MILDWITDPVADTAPAGPDLWAQDDPTYSEYYFDAAARLPEADDYAKIGLSMGDGTKTPDVIFDPKSVALKDELAQIDALLRRSRDLRLLTLRAQWCMLGGDAAEAARSVTAMADLLEAMPDATHPTIHDTPRDRVDSISDLAAVGAMILPLRYLDIGRTGATRRRVLVAIGEMSPHDGEYDLSLDAMIGAMTKAPDAVAQTRLHLTQLRDAMTRIEIACLSNATPHTPQIKTLYQEIDAVLAIIARADPEPASETPKEAPDHNAKAPLPADLPAPQKPATEVSSHDEARDRLIAVETYFGRNEPSSAAVLLVTQSRLLIGKSLLDVIDTLTPNAAPQAKVEFISENGFKLAYAQLRELANEVQIDETASSAPPSAAQKSAPKSPPTDMPIVTDAGAASAQILAVESYFRAVEKSSPIPMLLARARSYIGKDFETLLKELLPKGDF